MALQDQLHEAILFGDIAEVDSLLIQGADINKSTDNKLPLSAAILNGEIEVAVHLLQRGADLTLPQISAPETRSHKHRRLGSLQPSRGVIVALQIVLGMAVSIAISNGITCQGSTTSPLQGLHRVLDFWIPCGTTVISLRALIALQLRDVKSGQAFAGGVAVITVLLCLYAIWCNLPASTRWVLATSSSWIWKGVVWRALFAVGWNVVHQKSSHVQRKPEGTGYPGLEIIDSILTSKFSSEKLALALLDSGLFSEYYIREWRVTEQTVLMQEDPLITFWVTTASLGFEDVVYRLISLGVPVDTPVFASSKFNSTTLLAIAASSSQPRVVEMLLGYGAHVEGETPITLQSISPCTPLISCLLSSDRNDNTSSESRGQVVQLLIQADADVNTPYHGGESPLALAIELCSIDIVQLLLQHAALPSPTEKYQGTLIHSAMSRRDAGELLSLFGPDIGNTNATDDAGFTPLMRAAVEGKTDTARRLLALGADPKAKSTDGWTVLQLAAWYGPKALLELLLDTGVDVNACEQHTNTALFQASRRHEGRFGVLKLLLEKGAVPNIRARSWKIGSTPLHEVCRYSSNTLENPGDLTDQLMAVKILILHGADVNAIYSVEGVQNETDVTPLGLVAAHAPYADRASTLQILLEAGACPDGSGLDRR